MILKRTFFTSGGWGIGQNGGIQDLISDMSFKSIFINLMTSEEWGTRAVRGVQDLIPETTTINYMAKEGWGTKAISTRPNTLYDI